MNRTLQGDVAARFAQNAIWQGAGQKTAGKKTVELNREAVGEIVSYCAIIAAHDKLGFEEDKAKLDQLVDAMNEKAEAYIETANRKGGKCARRELEERTDSLMKERFILPAGEYPRKERERRILAEKRDAGDMAIRYFVEALDAMGYSVDDIHIVLEETKLNYSQFLDWAKAGGEYVAYTRLGRVVEQMTDGEVRVENVPGEGPIFAKEF